MPTSQKGTSQGGNALIGHRILRRIEIREKIRIQSDFLAWFSRNPLSERIGLCGSMALHGAFLHGRPSKDVDFIATTEDSLAFEHISENGDFPWAYKRDDIPLFHRKRYTISEQRPGYRVDLAIEFFCATRHVSPERLLCILWRNGQFICLCNLLKKWSLIKCFSRYRVASALTL